MGINYFTAITEIHENVPKLINYLPTPSQSGDFGTFFTFSEKFQLSYEKLKFQKKSFRENRKKQKIMK